MPLRVPLSLSFAFFKGDDSNFKYNRNIIVIDCLMQVLWIEFHHFQITWGKLARMWPSPAREWCPCPNQHSCHLDNCDPGANCCDVCRLCSFHCQCSNCECRAYCECRAACNECLLQLLGTRQLPVWSNFYGPVTFNLGLDILGKDSWTAMPCKYLVSIVPIK